MLYRSVSLADFRLRCSRESPGFQHQSSGVVERGCLYAPLAAPKVWLLGSPGEGQPVRQRRGAQARQGGYVAPGSRRQRTDGQSPIGLKNLTETRGRTLGKGCGDESNHPSRAKGTGLTAVPLWVDAGKILTLRLAVGMGQSPCENRFCGGISKVECEAACCCRSVGPRAVSALLLSVPYCVA